MSESNISEIGRDLKFMIKILFPGPKALPKPILGPVFGLWFLRWSHILPF